jgi:(p)ppGpp synthase/HD superfamily hydrolase
MIENHETFFTRIGPFFSPRQLRNIDLAYLVAKDRHRGQERKELDENGDHVRYFEHLRRATLLGLDRARIIRLDTTVASIVHDYLEDTRGTPEELEDWFGTDVCVIVKVLSKVPKDGYLDRFMICTDWRPFFIKACDRLDNLSKTEDTTPAFRVKLVAETKDKYYRLFDRMVVLTPEEYRDGVRRLHDAIHETAESISLT